MECEWEFNKVDECWDSSCVNKFYIIDGSPNDNDMVYCCYCGGELKQI